jgi:micrococcal nuclease
MQSRETKTPLLIFIFLLLSLFPSSSLSKTVTGKVVKVADGDTITILDSDNRQHKIRLYGIDTPEKSQAYGKKAKTFTANLVAGKAVKVKVYDTDRYGRSVGVVFVGGPNVNRAIIKNGFAWQYRKYCKASFCDDWLGLERQARNHGIGLWGGKNPQAPWDWRRAKKTGSSKSSKVAGGTGLYHGNKKSHVLHSSQCQYYNCKNCTVVFKSVNDAVSVGYRVHKQCVQ